MGTPLGTNQDALPEPVASLLASEFRAGCCCCPAQNRSQVVWFCTKHSLYSMILHKTLFVLRGSAQNLVCILWLCTKHVWCSVVLHKTSIVFCILHKTWFVFYGIAQSNVTFCDSAENTECILWFCATHFVCSISLRKTWFVICGSDSRAK